MERALFAMVAHRMADPGAQAVSVQHLYRAMDFLDDTHEEPELAVYQRRRTLFDKVRVAYFDTTSTYFECDEAGEPDEHFGLRQRGYSRDKRPDRRQIVVGLATDQRGLLLVSEVFSGDMTDSLTVVPMLERLKKLGIAKVVWVTDQGMTSDDNLAAVRDAKMSYVVGARLRPNSELRAAISADETPYTKAAEGLMVKELKVAGRRVVVVFAPESAKRDYALRAAAVERVGDVMDRVNAGADDAELTTNGWYKRLASKTTDGTWALDKVKLEREAQCDGTFVLEVSDAEMSATEAALAYKGLLRVESAFRNLKQGLDLRPVCHRLDARTRAHVTLCTLAYLLERVVELETRTSFEQVRKLLARLRAVELVVEGQRVWETSVLSPEGKRTLAALRLDAPPRVLQKTQ